MRIESWCTFREKAATNWFARREDVSASQITAECSHVSILQQGHPSARWMDTDRTSSRAGLCEIEIASQGAQKLLCSQTWGEVAAPSRSDFACLCVQPVFFQANACICVWLQAFISLVTECSYLLITIHTFSFGVFQSQVTKADIMPACKTTLTNYKQLNKTICNELGLKAILTPIWSKKLKATHILENQGCLTNELQTAKYLQTYFISLFSVTHFKNLYGSAL